MKWHMEKKHLGFVQNLCTITVEDSLKASEHSLIKQVVKVKLKDSTSIPKIKKIKTANSGL